MIRRARKTIAGGSSRSLIGTKVTSPEESKERKQNGENVSNESKIPQRIIYLK